MATKAETLNELIREIRQSFQDLGALGNALHERDGVTAAMRAVLQHLAEFGAETVPQIARRKNVSRQHIQTIVDGLLAQKFVETRINPEHKRSVLIALTGNGRGAFSKITERENPALIAIATQFSAEEIAATTKALRKLRRTVHEITTEEKKS